jgi:hypothetical protein
MLQVYLRSTVIAMGLLLFVSLDSGAIAQTGLSASVTQKGSAATAVTNYLTAAGTLDPTETKKYLATGNQSDMITEFKANKDSGWGFSGPETAIVSETIDAASGTATVAARVTFAGGSEGARTFMAKSQTFFLVVENGAWKISKFDPLPQTVGPGVRPL